MKKAKVTVVGAGFVGATTAQRIAEKDLADVVLIDVVEGLAEGKALDIQQSASAEGFDARIVGTQDYALTERSDVIVITAGLARKPGMSRDDLLFKNAEIVSQVTDQCARRSPESLLLIVTNPLDVMTQLAWKRSGFENRRVFGMAGVLDSVRYGYFIARELGISVRDVRAMVLGGHGDSMVPLPRYSTVNGIPLETLVPAEKIEAINHKTRNGGAEIVNLLKTGSAFYAPSSSACAMVEAILRDSGRILPCSVYLEGQYGLSGVYCGVPVKLGRQGVLEVLELPLTGPESEALRRSSEEVSRNAGKLAAAGFLN
ncbi:MAG TPA: malate dehydrogenase [Candidatus Omnitrophota bacterium]|nr:malate dehydrogenase [Candidatus Omnitrophota bacterium]